MPALRRSLHRPSRGLRLFSRAVAAVVAALGAAPGLAQVGEVIDVADLSTGAGGEIHRSHGSGGVGDLGVPVSGGHDTDGDGFNDYAFAAFTADPFGRLDAGEVYLVFGDGTTTGVVDTGVASADFLVVAGDGVAELTGSEIWMDDVTGDGVGDLLIARQNFDPGSRSGAGALTILVGGAELVTHAATLQPVDLRSPPPGLTLTTLVGAAECDRLGIWMRTGDVTGDGIADIVVGADGAGTAYTGAAYVVRGGSHLAAGGTIDLVSFGDMSFPLAGHLAEITPPASDGTDAHLGATVQIGDLDGDSTAEVLLAVTLNRAGAGRDPVGPTCVANDGTGGVPDGAFYIAWDDNFTGDPWADDFSFVLDAAPGTTTRINGNASSIHFGEELLAGFDFDGDQAPDLFVGDIIGDQSPLGNRPFSGHGYVLYDAASLKGLDFSMGNPPQGLVFSLIQGARPGDLAGDTAAAGDFNGDGIDDLAVASPHFDPDGATRTEAGGYHVLHGKAGVWPAFVDLLAPPAPEEVFITEIWGALGRDGSDEGDTLGYSADAGFIDGDGRVDLISNEMVGNGLQPGTVDVGNLVVISGTIFAPEPSFAIGVASCAVTLAVLQRRRRR